MSRMLRSRAFSPWLRRRRRCLDPQRQYKDAAGLVETVRMVQRTRAMWWSSAATRDDQKRSDLEFRYKAIEKWLKSIVIGQGLCPFAAPVLPKLRIQVLSPDACRSHDAIVEQIKLELDLLLGRQDDTNEISMRPSKELMFRPETTLVVLDEHACPSLKDWQDMIDLAWVVQQEAIEALGYEQEVAQVLFHPQAEHDLFKFGNDVASKILRQQQQLLQEQQQEQSGVGNHHDADVAAHYAIRSPFPTIHLIREVDGVQTKDFSISLHLKNRLKLQRDGVAVCQARLSACLEQEEHDD